MQENKIGGKFYRILIDEVNDIWDRLSFWTKASDVEMNSGTDLETKISSVDSAINTVNSTATVAYNTANSANSTANTVQGQLVISGTGFYFDYKNGKYGFNTSPARGADTFHPFSDTQDIYNALVAKGITPASSSPEDIVAAINNMQPHTVRVSWVYRDHQDDGFYYGIDAWIDDNHILDWDPGQNGYWLRQSSWSATV